MAYFRCGGGGMPAGLQSGMDAVLNKKFGTSTTYPASGWPDNVNLLGPLPIIVSNKAPIVSFADGADDVPIEEGTFYVVPSQAGTGTPSPSNPRAISGYTGMTITQRGKNWIQAPTFSSTTDSVCLDLGRDMTFPNITMSFLATSAIAGATDAALIDFQKSDGTHQYRTLKNTFKNENNEYFNSNDTEYNGRFRASWSSITFRYVIISYNSGRRSKFTSDCLSEWQLEVGSTQTAYTAYTAPETLAVSWQTEAGTVYGGELNVTTGVLTVTHGIMTLPATGWTYYTVSGHNTFNCIITGGKAGVWGTCEAYSFEQVSYIAQQSDKCFYFYASGGNVRLSIRDDDYTDATTFGQAVEGLKLVYPLATPVTYQLDPHAINTFYGANNFYCDTGDSQLNYRADISLYINNH